MIMKSSLKKMIHTRYFRYAVFLFIGTIYFFLLGYNEVANKGPFSQHIYRQSDSYAFALNYYYEKNSFFEPSILFVAENKGGQTVSEFPILYYLTAKIWGFTGVTPFIPRFINFLILCIGLFFLYRLAFEFLKDHFWAVLVSLSMAASPLIGYYAFNFLPNIPALGFSLIASFYFFKYFKSENSFHLIISSLFFALGGLLKISSLFAFLALNAMFFILNFRQFRTNPKAVIKQIASISFVLGVLMSWFLYTKSYNAKHLGGIFNQSILPLWNLSGKQVHSILDVIYDNTLIYFFNPYAVVLLIAMLIVSIIYWKKVNKQLLVVTSVLLIGTIMFIVLFFGGMDYHEYFLIDVTIIIPFILLTFLTLIKNTSSRFYKLGWIKASAAVLLLFLLNYNLILTRMRFNPNDALVKKNIPLDKKILDYWEYRHYDWEAHQKKYEGIVPYIRGLGIKFEDKVISIPDETPNVTLTLLQQKGFTDYHYSANYEGVIQTRRKIVLGAKYMIIEGKENLNRKDVAPFLKFKIGEYNGILIYRL